MAKRLISYNSYNTIFSSLFLKGILVLQILYLNLFLIRYSWSLQVCTGLLHDVITYYIVVAKIFSKTGASSARIRICVSPPQSIYSSYVRSKKIAGKKACYHSHTTEKWDMEQYNSLHRSVCGRVGKWCQIPCSAKL